LKPGLRVHLDQTPIGWKLTTPPDDLVDVMVAAIDADWSGLRVVWRVSNRPDSGKRR
jgi:hypothetical protein